MLSWSFGVDNNPCLFFLRSDSGGSVSLSSVLTVVFRLLLLMIYILFSMRLVYIRCQLVECFDISYKIDFLLLFVDSGADAAVPSLFHSLGMVVFSILTLLKTSCFMSVK